MKNFVTVMFLTFSLMVVMVFTLVTQSFGKVTITFQYNVPEPLRLKLVTEFVSKFEQDHPDIKVEVDFVPQAQSKAKLFSSIRAGLAPDVVQVWDPWLGELYNMGAIEDLTERVDAWDKKSDIYDSTWELSSCEGRIVALPLAVANDAIFYRTDRLKEVGLDAPSDDWTWNNFLQYCKILTRDADGDGIIDQYGFGMRGTGIWAIAYLTFFMIGAGGEIYENGQVVINSPECVSGTNWYADLYRKHKVTPPSAVTDGWRGIVEGFGRGITNMYLHNSGSIEEQKGFVGPENFSTVPIPIGPSGKRASFWHGEEVVICKTSKNKDAAWKFISYVVGGDAGVVYQLETGEMPVLISVAESPRILDDPHFQGFVKSSRFTTVNPYLQFPAWGGIASAKGTPLFQNILLGRMTAKEALDAFAEELRKGMR